MSDERRGTRDEGCKAYNLLFFLIPNPYLSEA